MNSEELLSQYKEFFKFCKKWDILGQKAFKGITKINAAQKKARKRAEEWLYKLTSFLPEDFNINLRMKYIRYEITPANMYCPVCKNKLRKWSTKNTKFLITCGDKDKIHQDYINKSIVEKSKATCLEKYGVEWAAQTPEFQESVKATNLKKYGTKTYCESEEFKKRRPEIEEKIKKNNLEKYGVEWTSSRPEVRERIKTSAPEMIKKFKKTNLERYGTEHHNQSDVFKPKIPKMVERMQKTNLKKYGAKSWWQSDDYKARQSEILEKTRATNRERYGYNHYSQSVSFKTRLPEIIRQTQATNQERYGAKNYFQSDKYRSRLSEYQEKAKATNHKKYGAKNYFQSEEYKVRLPEYQEKSKATNRERYGADSYQQANSFKSKIEEKYPSTEEYLKSFVEDNKLDLIRMMETINCSETTAYKLLRQHNITYKKRTSSYAEDEIYNFIKSIDPDARIIRNPRDVIPPKELDLYLPDYNLAIEYNGLMFHSQGISKHSIFNTPDKDPSLMYKKMDMCLEKGIQLLNINENEFLDPRTKAIWFSAIESKIGKSSKRIYARKCKLINEVPEAPEFLDENHLQGSGAIGPIRYGLTYNDELIAVMTFGKSRFRKKKNEVAYELIRFAVKRGYTIPGAASKLLKAFERNLPKDKEVILISYANRRWSKGNVYEALGFEFQEISGQNYYYFHPDNPQQLWHRASFQKHKLKDKLKVFNPKLTEAENMFNNGYRRIFDAGNYVFLKKIQNN